MAIERRLSINEDLYMGLSFSVTCAEDLPFITEEMIHQKTAGTFLGDYRIRQQKAVCEVWPRASWRRTSTSRSARTCPCC